MDYLNYKAEDFAADESFIAYHLKSDPDAAVFWINWLRMHPEKLDEVAAAGQLIDMLEARLSDDEFQSEREKFISHISSEKIVPMPLIRKINYLAIAACTALLIGMTVLFIENRKDAHKMASTTTEWTEFKTKQGEKSSVRLPDGSVIRLNGGSTLCYPKKFTSLKREIRLEGEAYFSVSHDPLRPFTVQTAALQTEVLGTEFNISAYKTSKKISVSLVRGKVKVSDASHQAILLPGRKIEYLSESKEMVESAFDRDAEIGWKEDKLVFKNADFLTIAKAIKRVFGYQLINQSKDRSWNYTGTFQQQTVFEVVENICFTKHLKYKVEKKTIYLSAEK